MAKETAWKNNYVIYRWYSIYNDYSIGVELDSPKSIVTIVISPNRYVLNVKDELGPLPDDLRSQIAYLFRKQYETVEQFVLNKNITVSFTDDFWCEYYIAPYGNHFLCGNRFKRSKSYPIYYDYDKLTEDPHYDWKTGYNILNNKSMNDLIHLYPLYNNISF